ncbi:hypothetical protein MMPV_004620 [Pyropia vietnamensis]
MLLPRTPLPPYARVLPGSGGGSGSGGGNGGGGGSPLPRVTAGVLAGLLTLGVVTYAGRASLMSAVLSRAVGAEVQVAAVEVDWLPRRGDPAGGGAPAATTSATTSAAAPSTNRSDLPAESVSPPLPPPPRTQLRPALSGPVVGLRDVVLTDAEGRVAARVPAVRVRFGWDVADAAAGVAAGAGERGHRPATVADVELLRPHAYLILDAPTLRSTNWGKLAAAASAARSAKGSTPTDGAKREQGGGTAANDVVPTTAAAVARDPPTFAGVRLRSVAFVDGADLSVATSVHPSRLSATAATVADADLGDSVRLLLPAPVHLPAATLDATDFRSLAAVEARLTTTAGVALARSALGGVAAAAAAAAGGVPPEVGATLRSAVGVGSDEARHALDAARAKIRQWKGGADAVDREVLQAFVLDHFRELAKTGTDMLDTLDRGLDGQGQSPAAEAEVRDK